MVQAAKSGGLPAEEDALQGIADVVVSGMEEGIAYVVGPGSTTGAVMDALGLEGSLLGVDVVRDGRLVARDVNEEYLLGLVGAGRCKMVPRRHRRPGIRAGPRQPAD